MGRKSYSYELEKVYYSQHWPRQAKPYLHLEPYLSCWLDVDRLFRRKRVLDIGAGECTYTRLIADRLGASEVVACELFPERMLPAYRENHNPNLLFVVGDCFRLPFESRSFDLVFGSLVLSQLPNLDEAVAEIRRVLNNGGVYVGIEPNPLNPVHVYRYFLGHRSRNQYLLGPKDLEVFASQGFHVQVTHFWARFPRLRNKLLATCMGILASLQVEGFNRTDSLK